MRKKHDLSDKELSNFVRNIKQSIYADYALAFSKRGDEYEEAKSTLAR
jgi:hypothetical protein